MNIFTKSWLAKKINQSGLMILIVFLVLANNRADAAKYFIHAEGTTFSPDTLTKVQIGDTIRWEWISGSHTTTSVDIPNGAASWDNPLTQSTTFFEYIVTVPGIYRYKCVPHESFSMIGLFEVKQALSIYNPGKTLIEDVKIFPNPVKEQFSLLFYTDNPISGEVRLINLVGELTASWLLQTPAGTIRKSFQIDQIQCGIYFVEVYSRGKRMITRKIIKK